MPTENNGYFLYHSIGQYPGKAADLTAAMAEFATVWSRADDNQWGYLLGQRQEFIDLWSKLIGAAEATATTCENVTQGLHMLMTALPDNYLRGKRVLVTADYFSVEPFPAHRIAGAAGFHP